MIAVSNLLKTFEGEKGTITAVNRVTFTVPEGKLFTLLGPSGCGKTTTFGRNRPWSNKATRRTFRPNLQTITVLEHGHRTQKVLCTKCIRTMVKTA